MAETDATAPRVSVLLPVYNTNEQYLRDAIDSILAQTFTDFELLVVNDASTDPTVDAVVRSYTDPRIRYTVNEKNSGISKTRNILLKMSRGEYLAVMDHDDISLPERFEREVAYLDAHPDTGVVSCQVEVFQNYSHRTSRPVNDVDIRLALMMGCALIHPASMIRKSVLTRHNIRYEEDFSPAEDYAMWCRIIPYAKFHNLPEVLFRYREHATNTSKTQKDKMDRAHAAVQALVMAEYPALYESYLRTAVATTRIKLFGCIPFIKIVDGDDTRKYYLFGILAYTRRTNRRLASWG